MLYMNFIKHFVLQISVFSEYMVEKDKTQVPTKDLIENIQLTPYSCSVVVFRGVIHVLILRFLN
jgi:hypothetical protein